MQLKVYKESPNAKLPTKAHSGDHCWDLYALEDTIIDDECTQTVKTGLRFELPHGYAAIVKERSGLALKGIIVGAGIIDNEYRGPINVILRYFKPSWINSKSQPFYIKAGDKIAQFKLEKTVNAEIVEILSDEFSTKTDRGENGFGSSDIQMAKSRHGKVDVTRDGKIIGSQG